MYKEFAPTEKLSHLVDCFWLFTSNDCIEEFKVLPDACTDLIVDLNQGQGFVSGTMTGFQVRRLSAQANLMGVRFKTEHFAALSLLPMREFRDLRIEAGQVFPSLRLEPLKRLNELYSVRQRIQVMEAFIGSMIEDQGRKPDLMAISAATRIRRSKGNIRINELAALHKMSIRQLQRRFKMGLGISLKEFAGIVRFCHAKNTVASSAKKSLLEIAFDAGFYDHSHMNAEFRRLAGESPSFFR